MKITSSTNNKICFIGLDCYPVITKSTGNDYIGGESVQISLLAEAFKYLGYDVSIICGDYGQPDVEFIDGIRIIKAYNEGRGIPVIRFLYRRIYCFMKALRFSDSDTYFQSCSSFITGLVALHCNLRKKPSIFIFRVASDADCMPDKHISTNFWQRYLYNYGLNKSDIISVQGIKQQALIKHNYNLDSIPVNMIAEEPENNVETKKDIDLLWVGNIRQVKRPDKFIELAELLPEYKFTFVGGPLASEREYFDYIKEKSSSLTNISFEGFIPYSRVEKFFERAKLLINTSDIEGFPNTFLQAWIRSVPVVSFFDPDNLIKDKSLGATPGNIEEMKEIINKLLSNHNMRMELAEKCASFAKNNYSAPVIARLYSSMILDATNHNTQS